MRINSWLHLGQMLPVAGGHELALEGGAGTGLDGDRPVEGLPQRLAAGLGCRGFITGETALQYGTGEQVSIGVFGIQAGSIPGGGLLPAAVEYDPVLTGEAAAEVKGQRQGDIVVRLVEGDKPPRLELLEPQQPLEPVDLQRYLAGVAMNEDHVRIRMRLHDARAMQDRLAGIAQQMRFQPVRHGRQGPQQGVDHIARRLRGKVIEEPFGTRGIGRDRLTSGGKQRHVRPGPCEPDRLVSGPLIRLGYGTQAAGRTAIMHQFHR